MHFSKEMNQQTPAGLNFRTAPYFIMHAGYCYGNNGKNNAIAMGLCAVFVVPWWRNKGLQTLNRMHNEVWGCAEILPQSVLFPIFFPVI